MPTLAATDRRAVLMEELDRILGILLREYRPSQVYLYGSLALGNVSEWSDLDLVIVKDTQKRFCDRTAEVLGLLKPRVGTDIVVYTPEEWAALSLERPFVRDEILKKGKLLYAA